MQWFIKEQVEEVASMNDLLKVVERARDNPLLAEEYLAREGSGDARAPTRRPRRSPAARCSPSAARHTRDRARPHPHRRRALRARLGHGDAAARGAHRPPRRGPLVRRRRLHVDDPRRAVLRRRGRRRGDASRASTSWAPTDRFRAELARRDSKVRFVQGDLHEPATIAAIGRTTSSGARACSTTRRTRC